MSEVENIKGSLAKESLISSLRSTIRQSKVTVNSVQSYASKISKISKGLPGFTSLPEVTFESEDALSKECESVKSTEVICNEEECFTFKALNNPGIYKAYTVGTGKAITPETGEEIYLKLVKQSKIAPIRRVLNSLSGLSLDLQFYGLDSRHMKSLSEALMNNHTVEELNLKGNVLSVDALYHLGQMLRNNTSIRKLNLQQCKIGSEGAEMLANGLICERLQELDLSYNEIGDDGMELLGVKLGYNNSIKKLNLSHNNLTHRSGFYLSEMMEENLTIQHLDLSWNQISEEQGLKKFLITAVDENKSLLSVNLSWNCLGGDKVANILKTFIGQHRSLRELNLSHNKFETASENTKIAKGVNVSAALQVLNLSYNGITADVAFTLLSNINMKATLRTLHLDNVWVKPEFEKMRRTLQAQSGIVVVIEGVSGGGIDIKGPDMQTLLLKRAHYLGYKPQKNKKDFGWFLLRLQKSGALAPVKKVKFEKLIQEDKIKFDEGMIDDFVKRFRDESKKIDLNLMLEKYMLLFPDTVLPVPKDKKKKKLSKSSKRSSPAGSPRGNEDGRKSRERSSSTRRSRSSGEKRELRKRENSKPSGTGSVTSVERQRSKTGSTPLLRIQGSKIEERLSDQNIRGSKDMKTSQSGSVTRGRINTSSELYLLARPSRPSQGRGSSLKKLTFELEDENADTLDKTEVNEKEITENITHIDKDQTEDDIKVNVNNGNDTQ